MMMSIKVTTSLIKVILAFSVGIISCSQQQISSKELAHFLNLVNSLRAQHNAPPVCYNSKLMSACQSHSNDQNRSGKMSHEGTGVYSSPFARISQTGFDFSTAAENVAAGQTSIDDVFNSWKGSLGHFQNMINPQMTMIGLAQNNHYWTMKMASPSGNTETCINQESYQQQKVPKTTSRQPSKKLIVSDSQWSTLPVNDLFENLFEEFKSDPEVIYYLNQIKTKFSVTNNNASNPIIDKNAATETRNNSTIQKPMYEAELGKSNYLDNSCSKTFENVAWNLFSLSIILPFFMI